MLGQAAPLATRGDAALKRIYFAVLRRRGRPKAKVALARRLLIRLYVMLRDQIDYDEFAAEAEPDAVASSWRVLRVAEGAPAATTLSAFGYRSSAGVLGVIDGPR